MRGMDWREGRGSGKRRTHKGQALDRCVPGHSPTIPNIHLPYLLPSSSPLRRPSLSPLSASPHRRPTPPPTATSNNPALPPPTAAPPTRATPLRPRSQYTPHLPPPAVPASYLIHTLAHPPHALPASSTPPPKRRPSASQAHPPFCAIAPVRTPQPFAFAFAPPIHNPHSSPPTHHPPGAAQRPPRKKAARSVRHP